MTESTPRRAVVPAVVALLMTAQCASGCGKPTDAPATESSSATTADSPLLSDIRRAADATKALSSAHLAIRTRGQVDSMIGISSADLDVRVKPLTASGMSTYQGQVDVPFRMGDDTISVRLFDEWTSLGSVSELLAPGLIDPTVGVAKILAGVTDPISEGLEKIDGVSTARISGTIPADTAKIMDPNVQKPSRSTVWISNDGSHRAIRTLVILGPDQSVETTLSQWNGPVSAQ